MIIQPSGEPFRLEGGRAGMGVCAGRVRKLIGGGAASGARRFSPGAHTPSQPSPFEGEGSGRSRLRQSRPSPMAAPIRLRALEEEA